MTDCGRIHEWIAEQGFKNADEAKDYVRETFEKKTGAPANPLLDECIDEYDFESEFFIDKLLRLHHRSKLTGRFVAIGLEKPALERIKEHLLGMR